MKPTNNANKRLHRLKGLLEKSFLVTSVILLLFVISQCGDKADDPVPESPELGEPGLGGPLLGGSASSNFTKTVLVAMAKGAAGKLTGTAIGWAMGAMGLGADSPDYKEQFGKIHEDLRDISTKLTGISDQLTKVQGELSDINCSGWQINMQDEISRIQTLMKNYNTMVSTAAQDSGNVTQSDISDWVDAVLAQGDYKYNYKGMDEILTKISNGVYGGVGSGALPACLPKISQRYRPSPGSFGADTLYYNQVKQYTDYYSTLQVHALLLLVEALHYRAWQAAGSPDSGTFSTDSVSFVCGINDLQCNKAVDAINTTYNNLIDQFTAAGAPYTNDDLVMYYDSPDYIYLLPYSLEDFTTAAGDNCPYPLTSAKPCGITAGPYYIHNNYDVVYKGYTGWYNAGTGILKGLLAGWKSGTAGDYLENTLGFKNMKNKIIIGSQLVKVELDNTYRISSTEMMVSVFFDTDFEYDFLQGGPASTASHFNQLVHVKESNGGLCGAFDLGLYENYDFSPISNVPSDRNDFYNLKGHGRICDNAADSYVKTSTNFSIYPGWFSNWDGYARPDHPNNIQYKWPAIEAYKTTMCTNGHNQQNIDNVWSMCGDDFTQWLNNQVPRPETCDLVEEGNSGAATHCTEDI